MEIEGTILTNGYGVELMGLDDGMVCLATELIMPGDEDSYIGIFTVDRSMEGLMADLGITSFMGFDLVTVEMLWGLYRQGLAHLDCYLGEAPQVELQLSIRDGKTVVLDEDLEEIEVVDEMIDSVEKAQVYFQRF